MRNFTQQKSFWAAFFYHVVFFAILAFDHLLMNDLNIPTFNNVLISVIESLYFLFIGISILIGFVFLIRLLRNVKGKKIKVVQSIVIIFLSAYLSYSAYGQYQTFTDLSSEKYWDPFLNDAFFPEFPGDFDSCGPGCAIEESGKIEVAKLPFVASLVKKYGFKNVEISALRYEFIEDKNYIKKLLGNRFPNLDCIIFVNWPDGQRVYIEVMENGEEKFLPHTIEEFEEMISEASKEEVKIFYENINDDQTHVRKIMELY